MSKRAVQAVLDQVAQDVTRLDALALRELAPILAQAERETQKALLAWLAGARNGGDRFTAHQLRRVLASLRSALDVVQQLDPALYATLTRHSSQAGLLATRHVTDQLARFSQIFGSSLNPIPIEVAGILARGDRMLIPRFRSSAERYAGQVGADIRRQLTLGLVRGETTDQMIKRLQRAGGPRGRVVLRGVAGDPGAISENIAEGLFRRYRSWAERVVRTETLNAYNTHADNTIRTAAAQSGEPLKRAWNAAADRRVCLECRWLDGKVTDIDKSFPGGYMHPPAHPHCRCSVIAWHAEWPVSSLP